MNPLDDITTLKLPKLDLPQIDKKRESNDNFMSDLIDAANEVIKAIIIVSGVIEEKIIEVEKIDILRGHIVRMYKLYDSYILLIVERKTETAFLILRSLSETIINLQYLLKYIDTDVHKKYMRVSLVYEKRLRDNILKNVLPRQEQLPIEGRILKNIKDTFSRSGFDNLEDRELKKTKWGIEKKHLDISGKAEEVGLYRIYENIFATSSHFVHGSWHELDFHHLEREGSTKQARLPQMQYTNPKPQLLEAISVITVETLQKYISTITVDGDHKDEILVHLAAISDWYLDLANQHEEYLQSIK